MDAVVDFIGGVCGGCASVFVGQSLDTVKVKMQAFPKDYKNALDCFIKTFRNEGVFKGLYAGTLPSLASQIAENSILFFSYGLCQKLVCRVKKIESVDNMTIVQKASAGSMAAFAASFALCPTELIKCRLQGLKESYARENKPKPNITSLEMTKSILKHDGILGLYRGFVSTVAREVPGYFLFFGTYEMTKKTISSRSTTNECGALGLIFSGGVGGMSLWIGVFPADVIKSRSQIMENPRPPFRMFMDIIKKEGVLSLYKGLGPTLLRTFPATGSLFLAYENTKYYLSRLKL